MKKNTQKTYIALTLLGALTTISAMGLASASAAETGNTPTVKSGIHARGTINKSNNIMGTITTINGTTLTVTTKAGAIYTVNASNATVKNKGQTSTLLSLVTGNTVVIHGTVTGTNVVATSISTGMISGPKIGEKTDTAELMKNKGVSGTITAISGTNITVKNKAGTLYTVDATNATVKKNGVTSTFANIIVGDTITAKGTVTGTNVTATSIQDGHAVGKGDGQNMTTRTPAIMGTVTTVNGSILTVTSKNGTVYTVTATNAKVMKSVTGAKPATGTLANVLVGDTVNVRGTLTGTSMVATNIFDGVTPPQRPLAKTAHKTTTTKTKSS